jgi:dihydrofolate reductase
MAIGGGGAVVGKALEGKLCRRLYLFIYVANLP